MNIEEFLTQTDLVLGNEGVHSDFGCSEQSVPAMIEYVKSHFPDYPCCVVADWKWVNMKAPPEVHEMLGEHGLKPSAVLAHRVVSDDSMRGFKSVRTTLLKELHKNCIFLTRNTAYILIEPGKRVSVDAPVFTSIFG